MSYQPAADETLSQFASLLFDRIFFQPDVAVAVSTWNQDVAEDAFVNINGNTIPAATFLELVKGFHATGVGKLEKSTDLLVAPKDPAGRTGTVAQSANIVVYHKDGKIVDQASVTIVQVEEKDGKRIMTSLVETTVETTRA
ncbi:hypothetical protein DFH07DRAFT_781429 [Mycena maculata]|uniref:Uncharacterized protein n=1 Tax=Mycena maculata TaxID=230809 RepID=A0AAD7HZM7_9AGAR|nr:hypothetical protein DFH07DRAFT_781429 [Mycena maculata]